MWTESKEKKIYIEYSNALVVRKKQRNFEQKHTKKYKNKIYSKLFNKYQNISFINKVNEFCVVLN